MENSAAVMIAAERARNEFAEVVVPLPLRQTFTYRLPAAWRDEVRVGARLLVSFGKQTVTAYVVALHETLDESLEIEDAKIKDALELLDQEPLLTVEIIELAKWTANYYACSWGEVLKAALPAGVNATIEQIAVITSEGRDELAKLPTRSASSVKGQILQTIDEMGEVSTRLLAKSFGESPSRRAVRDLEKTAWIKIFHRALTDYAKPKRRKAVRLLPVEKHLPEAAAKLTEAQSKAVETLIKHNGELDFTDLLEFAEISASAINTLEKRRVVEVFIREVRRDPLQGVKLPQVEDLRLTEGQQKSLDEIISALDGERYKAFLLHGVTGSGKTEVYIRAIRYALEKGKAAMMLVPEIALTPVFSRRLRAHFGDLTAIFHSNLSAGERFDEWRRLKSGAAKVVIGTRSAVFAPLENVGVIIVDEEHDASYRQNDAPFYNGRDVAVVRAVNAGAVVILGSATPALETFHNAKTGKYRYLPLPSRVGNRALARAETIDMREIFRAEGREEVFSAELFNAIEETHGRGEQSIILHNRRGFSAFVLCRLCGESIRCPNCDVTLTFHKTERNLVCHYCDFRRRAPDDCPNCGNEIVQYVGEGTQQIEEILRNRFPDLKIARVDRDTMTKRRELEKILLSFSAGEIDLLVGTQMLAKGHDFHNVTLVGVVSVDAGLALPDFRSAERTFQLITQVAGRAGRGNLAGRVVIQTYHPEHYALRLANAQDYEGFYEIERNFRENLGYPPFVALASFLIKHTDFRQASHTAELLRSCLERANEQLKNPCRILGPADAPIARLRNEHRLQILLKAKNRKKLRETIDFALVEAEALGADLRSAALEIDPINLL